MADKKTPSKTTTTPDTPSDAAGDLPARVHEAGMRGWFGERHPDATDAPTPAAAAEAE